MAGGAGAPGATRESVLAAVAAGRAVTAAALASRLGLTAAGVRRHLDALVGQGLLQVVGATGTSPDTGAVPRGRPARRYAATDRGARVTPPVDHRAWSAALSGATGLPQPVEPVEELALAALGHLARRFGSAAVGVVAEDRMRAFEDRWRPALHDAGPDPLDRARALAAALTAEGFAAGTRDLVPATTAAAARGRPGNTAGVPGVELCQERCPVHSLAQVHPELCEAETRTFSRMIGAPVQRLATIAHGDHVCTTFVPDPRTVPDVRVRAAPTLPQSPPEGEFHDHHS